MDVFLSEQQMEITGAYIGGRPGKIKGNRIAEAFETKPKFLHYQ